MPIPDEIRKCVGFLAYKDADGKIRLAGTVFFIAIGYPGETQGGFGYAVTAKHVIDAIKERSADGKIYFRLNLKGEGAKLAVSKTDDWLYHPTDDSVDVAAMNFGYSGAFDHLVVPASGIATTDVVRTQEIGIGDEVFIVGLFIHHYGQQRNTPIVRMGNIAAMPEEKILTSFGKIEAFLIESRSIGGLSGSPVFVKVAEPRTGGHTLNIQGNRMSVEDTRELGVERMYLLGLVHGHWDVTPSEIDAIMVDNRHDSVNVGVAIVVPGQKILEVLNHPIFERSRNEALAMQSGKPEEPTEPGNATSQG